MTRHVVPASNRPYSATGARTRAQGKMRRARGKCRLTPSEGPMNEQTQEKSTVASRSGIKEEWLALHREDVIEPALEIVDPHHHLWDFARHRYLLHDLLADTGSGHNVTQTVFIECTACYGADGPAAMRPVGETEFVNGIAAMSASGAYGPIRVAAGIVGFA